MHYYQFNIGDYSSHTSRLSLLEDLAYRRLIDLYYLTESPFTGELSDISRDIGMIDNEKEVEYILNKFFEKVENEWINKRASEEIRKYHMKKKTAAKAGKASGKARRDKASERVFDSVELNIKQEPLTTNHKPLTNSNKDSCQKTKVVSTRKPVPISEVINKWNVFAESNGLPQCVKQTKQIEGAIRQRWLEDLPDLTHWDNYLDYISKSKFLMGKTTNGDKRPFRSTLQWITNPTNFGKISSEMYHQ